MIVKIVIIALGCGVFNTAFARGFKPTKADIERAAYERPLDAKHAQSTSFLNQGPDQLKKQPKPLISNNINATGFKKGSQVLIKIGFRHSISTSPHKRRFFP